MAAARDEKEERRPSRAPGTIRYFTNFKNTIYDTFRYRGWKEAENETDWDIMWFDREVVRDTLDDVHLEPHQRVNHYRNHYELTRKDNLIKNLKRRKRDLQREGNVDEAAKYDFFPQTYQLPGEYSMFVETFKRSNNAIWIMKPIAKSQGKGIFLFSKLSQISDWKNDARWKPGENPQAEQYVAQEYVSNPMLIGGKKFDLRVYAMCTCYNPLTVYLSRTGFARFTSTRFSMNADDISNAYVHLTNVAVQKTNSKYDPSSGGKWNIRNLKIYLIHKYGVERVNTLFFDILMIMIRSLQSVQKTMINDKHCFELYGYDILIDENLKPWLLEVNASPSLTANTQDDWALKVGMLDDAMTLIDLEGRLVGDEEQVGGFDLVYSKNGLVKFDPSCLFTTYLGAQTNRERNLRKLAKNYKKRQQVAGSGIAGGGGGSSGSGGGGSGGGGSGGDGDAAHA